VYGTDYPVIPGADLLRTLEEIGEPVVEAVLERNPARVFGWEEGGQR